MSTYDASDVAFLLVDGYSILPRTGEFNQKNTATMDDITPFGTEWSAPAYGGLKTSEFTHAGFYDDAANSTNDALKEQEGVKRTVVFGYETNVIGASFTGLSGAYESSYERVATKGQVHRANGGFAVSGAVEEGIILHELSAEVAAGDTQANSINNGSATALGGSGYVAVTALTLDGYDDVTIAVQHSADDNTYGDLIAFTAVTAAPAAERKVLATDADVYQYLACSYAFTGAGTSPSATFFAGFVRNS